MTMELIEIDTSKHTVTRLYQTQRNKTTPTTWHVEKNSNYHQPWSASSLSSSCVLFLQRLFLPVGYPHSVRPEYLRYQMWDSIQGICSYLRGVLTTRSVLQGAGVGSATSSAVTAALVWVLKDGIGMIGSLGFAYLFSDVFETNIKEWRLFADFLNNVALTLDLALSLIPSYHLTFTALSAICKSCCWVCAGATKGRISAHFAVDDHLADVIAKESTQETAVALIGMLLGSICTQLVGTDTISNWTVFLVLLLVHQWSNYHLVRTLILDTLNPQRCYLIVRLLLLKKNNEQNIDFSPLAIARQEHLFTPLWLASHGPILGGSLATILIAITSLSEKTKNTATIISFDALQQRFAQEMYLIGVDLMGRPVICMKEGCNQSSMCCAYMQSCELMMRWERTSITLSQRFQHIISTDLSEYDYYMAMMTVISRTPSVTSITMTTTNTPRSTRSRSSSRSNHAVNTTSSLTSSSTSSSSTERIEDVFLRQQQWDITPGKQRLGEGPYRYRDKKR